MMRYIEFCAGAGGMRAGLDAAGWQCVLAIDSDPDMVDVHRLAHGSAMLADVTELAAEDLPEADAWVAGFPCQPFSSSGNRLGFGHRSGNVFEHLTRLMESRLPPLVVFENVEGLLTNKSGHTFAVVLAKLTGLGYAVSWLLVDLLMFGTPQTRPRLFLVASQAKVLLSKELQEANGLLPGMGKNYSNAFADFLETRGMPWVERSRGRLEQLEQLLRPAVGKARIEQKAAFGSLGHASDGHYVSFDVDAPLMPKVAPSLGQLVAPHFSKAGDIRSGRYYARGGPTTLCLRSELISHCIGTSLGGAPLYAVPLSSVENASDRAAFLEFSNWHREQDGVLVMRLRPDRAVMLFGPHTEALHRAVTEWDAGDTRKYKVVGNMVAPVCAKAVAELVNEQLLESPRPASFTAARPVVNGKETSRKSSLDHAATP